MNNISCELQERLLSNKNVKINRCIADDDELLRKNYSILLEYVNELEKRIAKKNDEINYLNRRINYYKLKEEDKL